MKTAFILMPGQLSLSQVELLYRSQQDIQIHPSAKQKVLDAEQTVKHYVENNIVAYGINTGFGKLANKAIPVEKLKILQKNLVLSHAAGTGPELAQDIVKLVILLKINALAQGYSGVRWEVIDFLVTFYNADIFPCIPSKGSVGASGDLAPLAHLASAMLGIGEVIFKGKRILASDALQQIHLSPLELEPKEGLALLNGTQVSAALALHALFECQILFEGAIYAGALSLEASKSDMQFLDERIHNLRRLTGQIDVAKAFTLLLHKKGTCHQKNHRVQDPYSLRCQPQVMGACLEQLRYISTSLQNEINAVTDNPLVFSDKQQIISGGNFHAQILSFASDAMANVIATIGNISERRVALLMDPSLSGLPAFLIQNSGVHSGLMIAQVTAASLASENKVLAHPASVDSIPTSANQEDHVSMATFAARRLQEMVDNTITIIAIELIAACQGLDLIKPFDISISLEEIYQKIRKVVNFYETDCIPAVDIARLKDRLKKGDFRFIAGEFFK